MADKWKIRTGDRVVVLTGSDRGKKGEVMRVVRDRKRAVVAGVQKVVRHQRPSSQGAGGRITREASVHISNLAHVDPKDGRPTRVGWRILEDGRKVRFARRSGETIDR